MSIPRTVQITTRKNLSNRALREVAIGILQEVANALRKFKLDVQCHDIKCLYGLIITHGEVVDSIINVAERWKEHNPSGFWYEIRDGDDEEDLERTIDMFLQGAGTTILHIRFYVDVLESPLRLKFHVEVATHEIKPSLDINLIKKSYLPMPLEPVETTTINL